MNCQHIDFAMNRRDFFGRFGLGLGGAALSTLLRGEASGATADGTNPFRGALPGPHFAPKAKRIIYLFMSGGPSQLDLFDYKPVLNERNGQDLPDSVRQGQRLTGMSSNQATLPLAGSAFKFAQHGQSGTWMSDLLPWTSKVADELCVIRSLHTEAINHDPAITFFQTGSQLAGRPSFGSWLSYGLGSVNENLPAFVVLISKDRIDQPLYARLWGNGFLPSIHQGVQFRNGKDPVLYLENPGGVSSVARRKMLDRLAELHALQFEDLGDPEINARVAQYEMAFRMQSSVPEVMDVAGESDEVFELYGAEARKPGTFAANCLLARRLAERDVRFIQLYHPGWDHHGNLPKGIRRQAQDVDQASYALITDLKRRGLLDETLVVWGGEFGRTNYSQGKLTPTDYGRDHHPRCFSIWMCGGGVKPGMTFGATDDFGYNVAENPVHVHDLQATLLHLLGIDHEKMTYKFQGRNYRLTDVHGHLVKECLA
ncbi:DUF1501 domain-containing protein [Tundrisphaera lichenicola]|uniref:DUF1501 domain-containing protein n=1 Tax=Tundrisphaera lichenicola TaxID=2029860 RepID=UPI003EBE8E72